MLIIHNIFKQSLLKVNVFLPGLKSLRRQQQKQFVVAAARYNQVRYT